MGSEKWQPEVAGENRLSGILTFATNIEHAGDILAATDQSYQLKIIDGPKGNSNPYFRRERPTSLDR